ncbi:hypothetical protein ES705_16986 [subsurface metagenome]
MAKFATLRYVPQSLVSTRLAPFNYINKISMIDWDDGRIVNLAFNTPLPVIGIGTLDVRVQVTETIENPDVDIPPEYLGR